MSTIPIIPPGTKDEDLIASLNDRIRRINLALTGPAAATVTTVIRTGGGAAPVAEISYGTHAQRLAAPVSAFSDAFLWYETDRTVWYQFQVGVVSAGSWTWIDGSFFCAQATLPADLGVSDAGFLATVTDYNHVLRWSGSAWTAGPNWDTPGYIRGFQVDPSPATGWKLCDGNGDDGSAIGVSHPVTYLKSDGTLGSITSATVAPCVPNLVGSPAFLQFGNAASGIAGAVVPTLAMNSYTPAGANSALTFTGSSVATSADSAGTPAGSINNATLGTSNFTAGAVAALTQTTHGHTFSGSSLGTHTHTLTAAGTINTPAFTGTPATLTGTISNTGVPPSVTLRPWFRK